MMRSLLLVAICAVALAAAQVQMCQVSYLFAGTTFTLNAAPAHPPREALVLSMSPIPDASGNLPPNTGAQMVASYNTLAGPVNAPAANGVLRITDLEEANRAITVSIQKDDTRPWPTPVSFVAYTANYGGGCSISVNQTNPFASYVASTTFNGDAAVVYFRADTPATGGNFFTLTVEGAKSIVYGATKEEIVRLQPPPQSLVSGQGVPFNSRTAFFAITPADSTVTNVFAVPLKVSIVWETRGDVPTAPPQPGPQPNPVVPGVPVQPPANPAPTELTPEEEAGIGFGAFFGFCIISFGLYIAGRSFFNYRVRGIETYPEFVPHHEQFAAIGTFLSALVANLKAGRGGSVGRPGYQDVDRVELDG